VRKEENNETSLVIH